MAGSRSLDCVTIGYYEPRFDEYEAMMRRFGEDSEAYRDLKFSFVQAAGRKMTYVELLSHAYRLASGGDGAGGRTSSSRATSPAWRRST
jgi:p-methyltransferase